MYPYPLVYPRFTSAPMRAATPPSPFMQFIYTVSVITTIAFIGSLALLCGVLACAGINSLRAGQQFPPPSIIRLT